MCVCVFPFTMLTPKIYIIINNQTFVLVTCAGDVFSVFFFFIFISRVCLLCAHWFCSRVGVRCTNETLVPAEPQTKPFTELIRSIFVVFFFALFRWLFTPNRRRSHSNTAQALAESVFF